MNLKNLLQLFIKSHSYLKVLSAQIGSINGMPFVRVYGIEHLKGLAKLFFIREVYLRSCQSSTIL